MAKKQKSTKSDRTAARTKRSGSVEREAPHDFLVDGALNSHRMKTCIGALEGLLCYADCLSGAEARVREDHGDTYILSTRLAERAREANAFTRILIENGLGALNDFRDSGDLDLLTKRALKSFTPDAFSKQIGTAFADFRAQFGRDFPNVNASPLYRLEQEVQRLIERNKLAFAKSRTGLAIRMSDGEGGSREARLLLGSRGRFESGRVSSQEFFGAIYSRASLLARSESLTCRSADRGDVRESAAHLDFYAQFVGLAATLRDVMHAHARSMDEVGLSYATGRKEWWQWLIIGLVCLIVLITVVAVLGGTGGAKVQVCGPDPNSPTPLPGQRDDRPQVCGDIIKSQSPLSNPWADVLLMAAVGLASATDLGLGGADGNPSTFLLPVQV